MVKASVAQIKEFFSVPGKPVTNQELIDFRRSDKEGWDKLATELGEYLAR